VSGLTGLLPLLTRARERLGAGALWAVVPVRVTRTSMAGEVITRLRERHGPLVTHTVIRENVRVGESPSWRQPVTVYAPTSPGAEDYRALAAELMARAWPA
jgi:chromosome partitioning protein